MLKCRKCGNNIKEGKSACPICGTSVDAILHEVSVTEEVATTKKIPLKKILSWIFLFPVLIVLSIIKSKSMVKRNKIIALSSIFAVVVVIVVFAVNPNILSNLSKSGQTGQSSSSSDSETDNSESSGGSSGSSDGGSSSDDTQNSSNDTSPGVSPTVSPSPAPSLVEDLYIGRFVTTEFTKTVDSSTLLAVSILPDDVKPENFEIVIDNTDVIQAEFYKLKKEKGNMIYSFRVKAVANGTATLKIVGVGSKASSNEITFIVEE